MECAQPVAQQRQALLAVCLARLLLQLPCSAGPQQHCSASNQVPKQHNSTLFVCLLTTTHCLRACTIADHKPRGAIQLHVHLIIVSKGPQLHAAALSPLRQVQPTVCGNRALQCAAQAYPKNHIHCSHQRCMISATAPSCSASAMMSSQLCCTSSPSKRDDHVAGVHCSRLNECAHTAALHTAQRHHRHIQTGTQSLPHTIPLPLLSCSH